MSKKDDLFFNACATGQLEDARKLLKPSLFSKGADVNAKRNDYPLLMIVVQNGFKDIAELLIANGADVNARNSYGTTPLFVAARKGDTAIAGLLVSNGADVNAKDSGGATALIDAVMDENPDVAALLLGNGAEPDSRGMEEQTALMLALQKRAGKRKLVELLISHGADVNAKKPGDGTTALFIAAGNNDEESVRLLLSKGADVNATCREANCSGYTALMLVAGQGHSHIAELLVSGGADLNMKNERGQTALDKAAAMDRRDIVSLLKSKGATQ